MGELKNSLFSQIFSNQRQLANGLTIFHLVLFSIDAPARLTKDEYDFLKEELLRMIANYKNTDQLLGILKDNFS